MRLNKMGVPDTIFGVETAIVMVYAPIAVVVAAILISLNLVIFPKLNEVKEINGKLNQLQKQKKVYVDKRNYLLSVDQEELKKNTDFVTNSLLPQKNGYVLVGMVKKLAEKHGFQIDSFSIRPGELTKDGNQPVTNKSGVAKLPINLVVIGPTDKHMEFINGIENSLPILSLNTLVMKNTKDSTKMEMAVAAYYVEDKSKYEIDKLTLSDLTLKQEESDLLSKLSSFEILEDFATLEQQLDISRDFVKYERKDPFSL